MARRFARTGIAAVVLAGTAVAFSGLPAQAQVRPATVGGGYETVILFYNNAAHTTLIGELANGCFHMSWGSTSSYFTSTYYACSSD
jgi:hypothetical protein